MPKKILVADDSPTIRNVAESLLKKHGYEVFLAGDGANALETAKLEKPDIIFLDHSLPLLNGEQVCKELKQIENLRHIPVIMFLSQDEVERERELKSLGVKAFIVKPFSPKEILDLVESLLRREDESPVKKKVKAHASTDKGRLNSGLDILETSDLMEDFDLSVPTSEKGRIHGFDWFLSELQKETQEEEKPESNPKEKTLSVEKKTPDKFEKIIPKVTPVKSTGKKEAKKDNQIIEGDTAEDFVEDVKRELEQLDTEEETSSKSQAPGQLRHSQFDQLLSDLKERISVRVAQEVSKMISPEFLEKIIREEIAHLKEHTQ